MLEVDIHHETRSKNSIYAAFGVPEIWRFDGHSFTVLVLDGNDYVEAAQSRALPILSSQIMTGFLKRLPEDGELQTILAFDRWLQSQNMP